MQIKYYAQEAGVLDNKIKNLDSIEINFRSGGSDEDRTRYLLHAMEALFQVSYGPTVR